MLIAALSIIAKMWKQSKCSLMDEKIKGSGIYIDMHIHTYSLKKKEILAYGTTWMKVEDIMLNEIHTNSQKNKYYMA